MQAISTSESDGASTNEERTAVSTNGKHVASRTLHYASSPTAGDVTAAVSTATAGTIAARTAATASFRARAEHRKARKNYEHPSNKIRLHFNPSLRASSPTAEPTPRNSETHNATCMLDVPTAKPLEIPRAVP